MTEIRSPIKRGWYFRNRGKPPPIIIKSFGIREGLVCAMIGPPSCGKSAIMLSAALAVATLGPDTLEGPPRGTWSKGLITGGDVLWFAAEGEHSVPSRLEAWMEKYKPNRDGPWPERFGVITTQGVRYYGPGSGTTELTQSQDLKEWCEFEHFYPRLIVLDTLAASLSNADLEENSAKGMGAVINWAHRMEAELRFDREYGPASVIVHHTGKNEDRGARGHSSLHGALDIELHVANESLKNTVAPNEPLVSFEKNRFGNILAKHRYKLVGGGPIDKETGDHQGVRAEYIGRYGR